MWGRKYAMYNYLRYEIKPVQLQRRGPTFTMYNDFHEVLCKKKKKKKKLKLTGFRRKTNKFSNHTKHTYSTQIESDSSGSPVEKLKSSTTDAVEETTPMIQRDQSPASSTNNEKPTKSDFFDTFDIYKYINGSEALNATSSTTVSPTDSGTTKSNFFETFDINNLAIKNHIINNHSVHDFITLDTEQNLPIQCTAQNSTGGEQLYILILLRPIGMCLMYTSVARVAKIKEQHLPELK
ncbi:unnamed protein product [Trichogramma brassicae]|uniref:Uncharacterized protein n=1 Tax=Trichogramma brassicae TaxID=86971 RepID=A0A6H5IY50_9HYME|nr:unnamed protein product [Trichogramma brassicae]